MPTTEAIIFFAEEPVSLIHVIIDIFLSSTQRTLTEFPDQAVKIAREKVNEYSLWNVQEHGALKGFLEKFDSFAESDTIFCNNASTCTSTRLETQKK